MNVKQSGIFARRVKKLSSDEKIFLDKAVKMIIESPSLGKTKSGDLAEIQVYRYTSRTREYLLAYRVGSGELVLTLLTLMKVKKTTTD